MCAKEIGVKMKLKEPIGDDNTLPPVVLNKLHNQTISAEDMKVRIYTAYKLTVRYIIHVYSQCLYAIMK